MENQEAYQKAKKRVEAKIGFYIHLAVYVGVNILLIIINLITSSQYLWFKVSVGATRRLTLKELTEPPHNTCLRYDYTANLQLISRPLAGLDAKI